MDSSAPPFPPPPPPPPPPGPPQPPHAPHRRLRRDRSNRILGGVAAGVARTYGVDVTLVRVLFVIAALFGFGIPAYIVAWIAIPPDRSPGAGEDRPRDMGLLAGLALLGIGVLILADHLTPHGFFFAGRLGFPLFLIAGGIAILLLRSRPPDTETVEPSMVATDSADEQTIEAPAATERTVTQTPADDEPPTAWTQTAPWPTARALRREHRREMRRQRPRPLLTPITIAALMIGAGVASLLQATGAADVNLTVVLAIMTCGVGAALLLSAFAGRARGLIAIGVLLAFATAVSSALDVPLRGGIGEKIDTPAQLADVRTNYEWAIGHLKIDLRGVGAQVANHTVDVKSSLGIGRLEIDVPSTVRVDVDAHVGAGSIELLGFREGGWDHDEHRTYNGDGPGVLHLRLRVGAGEIDVHRFLPDGTETLRP